MKVANVRAVGTGSLVLPDDAVHVWRARLEVPAEEEAELFTLLSSTERDRAARFRFPEHRRRFAVARARLRELLAGYTGLPAAGVPIGTTGFGKPFLERPEAFDFSVAHADDRAVYAFARRSVGIDIERVRPIPDMLSLARGFFAASEYEALMGASPDSRPRAFFLCWTRKEAYIKARGLGLRLPLSSFAVSLDREAPRLLRSDEGPEEPRRWHMASLPDDDDYVGAVAALGSFDAPLVRTVNRPS